jgi:hypothetical protein
MPKVITIKDVKTYSGMLVPSIMQSYNQGFFTITSTTNTVTASPNTALVVPSYATRYACEGINPKCVCGSTTDYYAMPMSAVQSSTVYAAFPNQKKIRLTIYEDIGGSANFEYFYLKYNGSNRASQTMSSVSNSWTSDSIYVTLNPSDTKYSLQANFGGMNISRRLHYSDNVCSPGSWKYVGKYNGVNFNPGIDGGTAYYPVSAITYYGGKTFLSTIEYLTRLKHVCIGVGYSSAPSTAIAQTSNSGKTLAWYYNYASTCAGNCSCDCNYCNNCAYTY